MEKTSMVLQVELEPMEIVIARSLWRRDDLSKYNLIKKLWIATLTLAMIKKVFQ